MENIERLNYYQRQFLGAEDFEDQQDYHRSMRHRHNLAHHTWGIVAGLELVELPQPGGGTNVDVFIQPGMAVDGYGREIVLLEPYRLDGALFQAFANDQHRAVWIAYDEELTRRPAEGYELCEGEEQFERVLETFRIVIEPKSPTHDEVLVGGEEVLTPPPPVPGDLTMPYDESVPYQDLPGEGDTRRWLVRLGSAHWDGVNSQFLAAAPDRLNEERRYVGSVSEEILAPARKLNIRDRNTDELPDPSEAGAAPDDGVSVEIEGPLQVDRLITAKTDIQIHGGLLDFRDSAGNGGGEQFTISRVEAGGAGGIDLRVKIGDESDGENRLVVGSADTDDKVTIADDGTTQIDGDVTVQNAHPVTLDGGQLNLQGAGHADPDWGLKVSGETLQFTEPDDGDRVVFELLDVSGDLANPVFRLQGAAAATLSASQLIDLTDGGITELHTHVTATETERGMVEIATSAEAGTNGGSGARLVVPANDPRLLTLTQKTDLTDGGLTTLHRHPNGILNNVRTVALYADDSTDIVTVNLGVAKRVVAFINLRAMDPRASFNSGDGFFADIYQIDGTMPTWIERWYGGAHFGVVGTTSNMMTAVYTGAATSITFRLRSMQDASVWAVGVVFYEDL